MVCITYRFFRGWRLLVLCVVVDGFCLDVAFTSGGGEYLHTTELCFGRLVTLSSIVLYGGLGELGFQILLWVYLSWIWLLDFVSL